MSKIARPSWDELFMYSAILAATRSSCNHLKTGAVVVKDKRIIATGYNGAPPGIENCLDRGCRKDQAGVDFEKKGTGNCRGTHAERNAMLQIAREDLKGSKIYTLFYPCSDCAKDIIGAGLSEIIYYFEYKGEGNLVDELIKEATTIGIKQLKVDIKKYHDSINYVLNQKK